MENQIQSEKFGDTEVAILLPSRYKEGDPIPPELCDKAASDISTFLSRKFGGATGMANAVGAFKHDDGRIISETVRRIHTAVSADVLQDDTIRRTIFDFAGDIAVRLHQESIGVEWGPEFHCVGKPLASGPAKRIPYDALSLHSQEEFARIAIRQVGKMGDLATLLSLDGWKKVEKASDHELKLIAAKGSRKAFVSETSLTYPLRRQYAELVAERDYVFDRDEEKAIRIWMKRGLTLSGGWRVLWPQDDGQISRASMIVTMALLGSKYVDKIENIIDRHALTKSFFREYQGLRDRISALVQKQGYKQGEANLEAQILLGRMMFLKFLEQKGWLANDAHYLAKRFRATHGDY